MFTVPDNFKNKNPQAYQDVCELLPETRKILNWTGKVWYGGEARECACSKGCKLSLPLLQHESMTLSSRQNKTLLECTFPQQRKLCYAYYILIYASIITSAVKGTLLEYGWGPNPSRVPTGPEPRQTCGDLP